MMRTQKLTTVLVLLALLGAAGLFSMLAPDRYGLPEFEISEPGDTGERLDDDNLFGNYFPAQTSGDGPHPAILLLGGSEGGLGAGAHSMALALQEEGFNVLHLSYFGAPGQPDALERISLELFDDALDWLKARAGVDPDELAVVGASKGAEAALLIASRRDDLRAVVAGMPTSVVWNGVDWGEGGQSPYSSWSASGEDLVTMPFSDWSMSEGIISVYRSIEDPALAAEAENAAIPIESATARILLVCGEAETMWPACPMSRMLQARSEARSGPLVSLLAYEDAGHLLFGPPVPEDNPFYERLNLYGGSIRGNASARLDGWPKVVTFLKTE